MPQPEDIIEKNVLSYIQVHTDGFISFNQSVSFTVSSFPLNNSNIQLIAPFFVDADTTRNGTVWFRETNDTKVLKKAEFDIDRAFPDQSSFQPKVAFITTWDGLGYHDTWTEVDLVGKCVRSEQLLHLTLLTVVACKFAEILPSILDTFTINYTILNACMGYTVLHINVVPQECIKGAKT